MQSELQKKNECGRADQRNKRVNGDFFTKRGSASRSFSEGADFRRFGVGQYL